MSVSIVCVTHRATVTTTKVASPQALSKRFSTQSFLSPSATKKWFPTPYFKHTSVFAILKKKTSCGAAICQVKHRYY